MEQTSLNPNALQQDDSVGQPKLRVGVPGETGTKRPSPGRDLALDMVKGVCVIVMVLYHSIGYFPDSPLELKYVNFVTGAFIFLAGFVATSVYCEKYDARQQWRMIFSRLATRGFKLVLMAVVLNLLIFTLLPKGSWKQGPNLGTMLFNLFTGFDYHSVSFDLLVMIGYSLMVIGACLAVAKGRSSLLVFAAGASVIYAFVSNHFRWPCNYYVRLFAIGQVGAAVGLLGRNRILEFARRLEMVVLLYFAQLFLVIFWPPGYLLYLIVVICTVLTIYALALKFNPDAVLSRKLTLLGNYSLLSYLFQIAFLQVLRRMGHFTDEWVLGVFVLTCFATLGFVEITDTLSKKSKAIGHTYRWVFG